MRKQHSQHGFTLLELMIVVGILGILAAVAIVSYSKYVERAHSAEATSILADIRIKQDAYRATFKQYASAQGEWAPDGSPGQSGRLWDRTTDAGRAWAQLGIIPDNDLYYSYMFVAGAPGDAPNDPFDGIGIEYETDFWYAARAVENLRGRGICSGFEIYSGRATMVSLPHDATLCP